MKFVDEVTIYVQGGKGGDGGIAWRREKYVPKGGPAGGNGGNGGNIIARTNPQLTTLLDFRYRKEHRAENGQPGKNKSQNGRSGKDTYLDVPIGTLIYDQNTNKLLADLSKKSQEFFLAKGGQGGRGNQSFLSSTNRSPHSAEAGKKGEERSLRFELKLLADIGILGFPNVGKSTFISRISQAKPKIADYPFTTLVPNLGVVGWRDFQSFVIADIPGLVEGASQGAGLGLRFLRHIERTQALLHILEVSQEEDRDPLKDFHTINQELFQYEKTLSQKPQIVALNKIDLPHVRDVFSSLSEHFQAKNIPFYGISAATGEGISQLKDQLGTVVFQNEKE